MSCVAALIALLVGLLTLGPGTLFAAAEYWPDGISDAEADEMAPAAEFGELVVESAPRTGTSYEPVVIATVLPLAVARLSPLALAAPCPRAPPVV